MITTVFEESIALIYIYFILRSSETSVMTYTWHHKLEKYNEHLNHCREIFSTLKVRILSQVNC
jgi:hypothetical protein